MKLLKTILLNNNNELKNALHKHKERKILNINEEKLVSEYSDLFHFIDIISNYWIDKNGNPILLDWWNYLIWKLLKDNGNDVFNILFKKINNYAKLYFTIFCIKNFALI